MVFFDFCSSVFAVLYILSQGSCFAINLKIGQESQVYTTECGQYGYFEVDVLHPCDDLNIMVKNISGEPNLYVSIYEFPTYRSLAWSSYEWGGENMIISSWDPSFRPGKFYIGVHAYCGDDVPTGHQNSKYTLLVKQIPHTHPNTDDLFNRTASGHVKNNTYEYHRFCLPSDCFKVEVLLLNCIDPKLCPTSYAWPELIISPNIDKATEKSMAWILGDAQHRSIVFEPNNPTVRLGHYYITVYGWCTPDHICHDKSQCGPCSYALDTTYNISVKVSDLCAKDSGTSVMPSIVVLFMLSFTSGRLQSQIYTK